MEISNYMGYELIEKIKNKEITILEIIEQIFQQIKLTEERLHSFVYLDEKKALQKAKDLDNQIRNGNPLGKLKGLPIAIKDVICVKDSPTTCCSKILEGFKPPYHSTVVKRVLEESDGICIGRTNMDEFAMGSSTENSCYGPTFNPWNLKHVPGGSSGGSASAVSALQTVFALGSDTGGSIRAPASYCGVVGLKPTYGRVSRYGLIAYANSLDVIGPITRCVKDSALLLEVIAGYDSQDSTAVNKPVEKYSDKLNKSIEGKVIGIPEEFFVEGVDDEVKRAVEDSIHTLKKLGVEVQNIHFPNLEFVIPTYYIIAMSEASSNLARFDGLRYGEMSKNLEGDVFEIFSRTRGERFGNEVRRRIILGTYALSAGYYDMFYIKALKIRNLIRRDFQNAFEKCDVIISPTMPTTAFKIGELVNNPLEMYLMDVLTCPINLAGIPAISIPCGFDKKSLPIGVQIIGNYFEESSILNFAYQLEQKLNIYREIPPIALEANNIGR